MGSLHDAVMQFVEQEMKKDPGVKNATLFAGACEIDESIGELRPQQFHARYRLPVTRRMAEQRQPARPCGDGSLSLRLAGGCGNGGKGGGLPPLPTSHQDSAPFAFVCKIDPARRAGPPTRR